MPKFSKRSLTNLTQCHPNLVLIANEAIQHFDFTVICGHRNEKDQQKAFDDGFSKVRWPHSKHNKVPSLAFDAIPHPLKGDWDSEINRQKFIEMRQALAQAAKKLKIKVRFIKWDMPHIELA